VKDPADALCADCRRDIRDAIIPYALTMRDVKIIHARYNDRGEIAMTYADMQREHGITRGSVRSVITRLTLKARRHCALTCKQIKA